MNRKGKSIGNMLSIKKDFFEQNEKALADMNKIADLLMLQPIRRKCKICSSKLPDKKIFTSHRIGYLLCENCGHLNSEFEDTNDFSKKIYIEGNYAGNYSEEDIKQYNRRLTEIYKPKADFLLECMKNYNLSVEDLKVLDYGAGSGYFVRALIEKNVDAHGVEISYDQTKFANDMAGNEILSQVDANKMSDVILHTDCNVLSAMGVFEHVINLNEILEAIANNHNIEYVYFSVPMFSFSVLFELVNQDCFNRQLGGGHTHLFSDKSLNYISEKIGFKIVDTWKFGSDIMDLFRFICVKLEKNGNSEAKELFVKKFVPLIDELQLVIDESEFASENHVLMQRI